MDGVAGTWYVFVDSRLLPCMFMCRLRYLVIPVTFFGVVLPSRFLLTLD
jgi:hypothetical protein